eukprot:GHVR01055473.1.p1 GENE.GHVR01055473.1~~GHVR01055473.1.p1  ORF type:complete len:115 (-),score=15.26 GHVR01055473.1:341-685(-)
MIDVGSFIGGLFVGAIGDKYSHRALFLSPLLFISAILMFMVSFFLTGSAWQYYIIMVCIGITIGGPYNIIGTVIAIDLGKQVGGKNIGAVTGLIEGSAAAFAALSQIIISLIPF